MVEKAMKTTQFVTVEQLKEKIDNGDMILLIDVREPAEHNAGYIPGSLNIPRGVLEFKIGNEEFWDEEMLYMPEKDEELILYCKKGKRSILAVETLKQLGYQNVTYLDEGWKKWEMTYPLFYEKNLDQLSHEEEGEAGGC
jgi:rhodanese-related sulfurtransferase